jgi:pyruvate/2-oxoglutarate dehydrogenase complex dihydrolipoamide acyltransferase (E2) component
MDVTLPKWGVTMQEATVARWLVAEGAQVAAGQPIAEIETDKVDVALEAPTAGTLARQCVAEGAIVKVGGLVAVIHEG